MSSDLYFTLILSFFFQRLISDFAERNSSASGHMAGSKCNLKMHVQNLGYPFPLQIGGLKTIFLMIAQLKGNFNGLCLWNADGDQQTELQVMDSKSPQQTAVEKSEPSLLKKWGPKNFYICAVFRRLWD